MHRKVFLALAVVCCLCAAVAHASTTVTAGNWVFMAGTTNNVVTITSTTNTADTTAGINFRAQIGLGVGALPLITFVDFISAPSSFAASNTGQANVLPAGNGFGAGDLAVPTLKYSGGTTTIAPAIVSTAGSYTLKISTVGVPVGIYDLRLTHTGVPPLAFSYSSNGTTVPVMVRVDGTIEVTEIPEPASIVLGLFAVAGLAAVAIRRRRARKTA